MNSTLLVEIGVEELPAGWVETAASALGQRISRALDDAGIEHSSAQTYGTPRRIAVLIDSVAGRQPDREQVTRGPSAAVAFDHEGQPTKAANGFARGQGVDVSQLEVRDTDGGRYVFATVTLPGRPTVDVLADVLPTVIAGLDFPVSMRWGSWTMRFGRPIRWLCALFGAEVIPVLLPDAGVSAGRVTRGHRSVGDITLDHAGGYVQALSGARVMAGISDRKQRVETELRRAASDAGAVARIDPTLLDEVACLVEWPQAVIGRFDPQYLELPAELLITVMAAHQRYFPLLATEAAPADPAGASGREYGLDAGFCCIINGGFSDPDGVTAGNERVLRARLEDAAFFFNQDTRRLLPDLVPDLDRVVFFDGVGTVGDRARRLERSSGELARALALGDDVITVCRRAGLLAKADLVTRVVGELPELGGAMGRVYARMAGESEPVATAIGEHVLPRFPGDRLPGTMAGVIVALADRADALAGLTAAGVQASGSQDPYGLRRLAAAIVTLCDRLRLAIDTDELVSIAIAAYGDELPGGADEVSVREQVVSLLSARVRGLFEEKGIRRDVTDAVLASGIGDVPGALGRAEALTTLLTLPELDDAITVYRRTGHLAGDRQGEVNPALFAEPAEQELYDAVASRAGEAGERLDAGDYLGYLKVLAGLRGAVDRFFDDVLVMTDDEPIRQNRLNLLRAVARQFTVVGDLRRLVIG